MTGTIDATAQAALPETRWRTRDIVVAAVIGVAFGVVFWVWGLIWYGPLQVIGELAFPLRDLFYAVWLVPAVLGPLIIRKPGAALFTEMVAAGRVARARRGSTRARRRRHHCGCRIARAA